MKLTESHLQYRTSEDSLERPEPPRIEDSLGYNQMSNRLKKVFDNRKLSGIERLEKRKFKHKRSSINLDKL